MASPLPREENVYMAKLAQWGKRYEEMVEFMEKVFAAAAESDELTVKELKLLSVAYKNVIAASHASWWIISSISRRRSLGSDRSGVISIQTRIALAFDHLYSRRCPGAAA